LYPWTIAEIARECIAYSNEYRGNGKVDDHQLERLARLAVNLTDPFATEAGQPDAADSMIVRYAYQQRTFTSFSPLDELARLVTVCGGVDGTYDDLDLEIVTTEIWTQILGMPLETFARAGFAILALARTGDGQFDPAWTADPNLGQYGVTAEQLLHVFHHFMAAEIADLKVCSAADRHEDPALRRLDFNPLVVAPFVGLGGGRYVAPSMHLAEQRLSLNAIYYLGLDYFKHSKADQGRFTSDIGKLIEAYVGRQLGQLSYDALVPEQVYGPRKQQGKTCDWVLAVSGTSTVFEVKAARIARPGRLNYPAHLRDMHADVGKALEMQIPVTVRLIQDGDPAFEGFDLPTDVLSAVVTAEPHLMINSPHYRSKLPDPGCPYVVLSLSDLERFVAAVLAGVEARGLMRSLTSSSDQPESVIATAAEAFDASGRPENPLLSDAFDQITAVLRSGQ
jgi:hypothetical protein